jgi:hypothetical protein
MKFFNIDFHISVIADLQHIFKNLGHEVDDWCMSGHNWVLGKKKAVVPCLDGWERIIENQLWHKFSETYPELEEYDGFICTYPPVFAMLFENFNKPIIIDIPIRYEHPFTLNRKNWEYWNDWLRKNIDSGKVIPVCNSKFEKLYFESYVNREATYIPNLCEYTGMDYKPNNLPMIYGHDSHGLKYETKRDVGVYKWVDLCQRRSLIHFPYQTSTMSIFEQYTANIPLIFPSIDYSRRNPDMLHQVLWSTIHGKKADTPDNSINIEKNWLDYLELADYYDWPHINYFDSIMDINYKVGNLDYQEINLNMKEENVKRKEFVYSHWKEILNRIKKD